MIGKFIGGAALAAALIGGAQAQETYPSRAITIVTPFAAGGGSDITTRMLADSLRSILKQPIVVQNTPGAGGTVGTQLVARSAPDGYTLLLHHVGMATAPALYSDLQFDPLKSFEQVGLFTDQPMVIVSRKGFPANNLGELVAHLKKNEGKVNFAAAGLGSATHLCGILFEQVTGTSVTMIQYKGASPALVDLQGERVDLLCDAPSFVGPHVATGALKAFVVTGDKRLPTMPTVPSSAEAGIPRFDVSVWYGLYAPAGTPKPIVDTLSRALQAAIKDPAVIAQMPKMETVLFSVNDATPAAHREKLASQIDLWRSMIRKAGITPN